MTNFEDQNEKRLDEEEEERRTTKFCACNAKLYVLFCRLNAFKFDAIIFFGNIVWQFLLYASKYFFLFFLIILVIIIYSFLCL